MSWRPRTWTRALARGFARPLEATAPSMFEFLGVDPVAPPVPHAKPSASAVEPHSSWNPTRKEEFARQHGGRWYPGWRDGW